MDFLASTRKYEAWLGERIPLIHADIERKHALMAEGPFPFLRATFYRWAQTWPHVSPETAQATPVLAVGDLHIENFGTWRDMEGRLIWGINDFDEAAWMPYTCDLVRLAVSAHLAIAGEHLDISPLRATRAIIEGYRDCLQSGGRAFVLAEHHPSLRHMAVERLKQPELYWDKLHALPNWRGKISAGAMKALERMMPEPRLKYRIAHRVAGIGSLGRRRFVALAEWRGGSIAREAKELTDSAWDFANKRRGSGIHYQEVIDHARRCPDPFVKLRGRWIVRRLAPDCSRIELSSLPAKHDAVRLLHAMGSEIANVHLGSAEAKTLDADIGKRPVRWLDRAALAMVESVEEDWNLWRKKGAKG
jgi:Uncharacterized protein conserved in bacteria (DUF2252)